MKSVLLVIIAGMFFCSCKSKEPQPPKEKIPAPLQENAYSDLGSLKRGYEDLLESLYNELEKKDPQLKALGDSIEDMQERKTDSLHDFAIYQQKNRDYYSAAENHLQPITDSSLKKSMEQSIANSKRVYESKIETQTALIKTIDQKIAHLADLYIVLKITRTLPIISDYQKTKKIAISPLETISKQYDGIIGKAESLIRK